MNFSYCFMALLGTYALCAGLVRDFRNAFDLKDEPAAVYYISPHDCQAYIQHIDRIRVDDSGLNVFLFENVRAAEM